MVTRETKVGIVVSCSFLCLLGVVLVSKLKGSSLETNPDQNQGPEETALSEPTAPTGPLAQAPTPLEERPGAWKPNTPAADQAGKAGPSGIVPTKLEVVGANGPSLVPMPGEPGAPVLYRSSTGSSGDKANPLSLPNTANGQFVASGGTGGMSLPQTIGGGGAPSTSAPTSGGFFGSFSEPPTQTGLNTRTSPVPANPAANSGSTLSLPPTVPPTTVIAGGNTGSQSPTPALVVPPAESLNLGQSTPPSTAGSLTRVTILQEGSGGKATPALDGKDDKTGPGGRRVPQTPEKGLTLTGRESKAEEKRNGGASDIPTGVLTMPQTTPVGADLTLTGGKDTVPTPPPAPVGLPAAPARSDTSDRSGVGLGTAAPRLGPTQVALAPSAGLGGGSATPRSAPITPEVDSFDEAVYTPQAGETLANIATRYYGAGTEKYGEALLWYNRSHPEAGEGIRQEPPALVGQRLFIPLEKRVLEKRYPRLIPGLAAPAAPTPAAPFQAPPPVAPAPTVAPAPAYPLYRVTQKDGETMFNIAQRTLGNGFRWKEIATLNPNLTSDFAVEADKVLKLPPDARIDPDHLPR